MRIDERIEFLMGLDGSPLSQIWVYEAIRAGATAYLDPEIIDDESIMKSWGIFSPAEVRAKMRRLLNEMEKMNTKDVI